MEKDKKAMYESPVTKETQVNLESGICTGSVIKDGDSRNATTTEHKVNTDFTNSFDSSGSWND